MYTNILDQTTNKVSKRFLLIPPALTILHIRHLLTTDLAQTLACSLILSRIDYCNAVPHGAPTYTIRKLHCVKNNAARIVLQAPRRSHTTPWLNKLHWLLVQQRIDYKVTLLTFKVRSTSTPSYRPLRRCADCSPRQQSQSALSAAQHQPSGTAAKDSYRQ